MERVECPSCGVGVEVGGTVGAWEALETHLREELLYAPFRCALCLTRFHRRRAAHLHFALPDGPHPPHTPPTLIEARDPVQETLINRLLRSALAPAQPQPPPPQPQPPPPPPPHLQPRPLPQLSNGHGAVGVEADPMALLHSSLAGEFGPASLGGSASEPKRRWCSVCAVLVEGTPANHITKAHLDYAAYACDQCPFVAASWTHTDGLKAHLLAAHALNNPSTANYISEAARRDIERFRRVCFPNGGQPPPHVNGAGRSHEASPARLSATPPRPQPQARAQDSDADLRFGCPKCPGEEWREWLGPQGLRQHLVQTHGASQPSPAAFITAPQRLVHMTRTSPTPAGPSTPTPGRAGSTPRFGPAPPAARDRAPPARVSPQALPVQAQRAWLKEERILAGIGMDGSELVEGGEEVAGEEGVRAEIVAESPLGNWEDGDSLGEARLKGRTCRLCGSCVVSHATRHLLQVHVPEDQMYFACNQCSEQRVEWLGPEGLKDHLTEAHGAIASVKKHSFARVAEEALAELRRACFGDGARGRGGATAQPHSDVPEPAKSQCGLCLKPITALGNGRAEHAAIHLGQAQFLCRHCPYQLRSTARREMLRHLLAVHKVAQPAVGRDFVDQRHLYAEQLRSAFSQCFGGDVALSASGLSVSARQDPPPDDASQPSDDPPPHKRPRSTLPDQQPQPSHNAPQEQPNTSEDPVAQFFNLQTNISS